MKPKNIFYFVLGIYSVIERFCAEVNQMLTLFGLAIIMNDKNDNIKRIKKQ